MAINQCDGCALGWPVNENGNHIPPNMTAKESFWRGQTIGCTKDRYEDSEEKDPNDAGT